MMTIKSKFTFRVILSASILLLGLPLCIYSFLSEISNYNVNPSRVELILIILILIPTILSGVALFTFNKFVKKISIDKEAKTISFKSFFNKKNNKFSFAELDGYYTTIRRVGSYYLQTEIVILVKDNVMVGKISSGYYSNYVELISIVNQLNYIGELNCNNNKFLKIQLGQPIIK